MKTILVVDDQMEVRELVEVTLLAGDYTVHQAQDGHEAIEKARTLQPDLMILDIMMPGIDGYEVCKTLKQDADTQHIHILMLTARGQELDKQRGAAAGADGYFVKPFSPLELLAKIEEVLG